jgi:hypothetical protein
MAMLDVVSYSDQFLDKWDEFVLNQSINGTILQTRKFLGYHDKRFVDSSLLFEKSGTIVAVFPAAVIEEDGEKVLYSHPGSTFGGFIISEVTNNIDDWNSILSTFNQWCVSNSFAKVVIKPTGSFFCSHNQNILEYFLFNEGYESYDELSFCVPFNKGEDIIANLKSKTRNLYRKSLKFNLEFKPFSDSNNIKLFHSILTNSLAKHDAKPVHSYDELLDLQSRLGDKMRFYGVFLDNRLIAGSMVFILRDVFHTQYLAADPEFLYCQSMDFLNVNLISLAFKEGFRGFSFGISTENHGHILNFSLAKFKEGFGTVCFINKTFSKDLKDNSLIKN